MALTEVQHFPADFFVARGKFIEKFPEFPLVGDDSGCALFRCFAALLDFGLKKIVIGNDRR